MFKSSRNKNDGDSSSNANSSGVYIDLGESYHTLRTQSQQRLVDLGSVQIGTASILGIKHAINEDRACKGSFEYGGKIYSYAGVFDGHGGHQCADYMSNALEDHLKECFNKEDAWESGEDVMKELFSVMDREFTDYARRRHDNSGTCATVVIVRDDTLLIGNIGDCSGIMVPLNGTTYLPPVEITHDHRADSVAEYIRIKEAGGSIADGRVNKLLHPSRTFGDLDVRDIAGEDVVIPEPDVDRIEVRKKPSNKKKRALKLTRKNSKKSDDFNNRAFLMIASDGVWDFVDRKEAATCVKEAIKKYGKRSGSDMNMKPEGLANYCAAKLVQLAQERESDDDMTAAVLLF